MKIRFLGVPLSMIDRLCEEEEIVKVTVSTYKREVLGHYDGSNNAKTTIEEVQTGGWGCSIRSSKDLIQFLDDNDESDRYNDKEKNEYSDSVREKFR